MSIMEKIWASFGIIENQKENDEGDEIEIKKNSSTINNVVNLRSTLKQQLSVIVMKPANFDSAQNVADYLKNRKPVVINFENTEKDIAKRMIDFISGTTYALNGTIQKIGGDIFLCAPCNIDISYTPKDENCDKSIFPWACSGFNK